MSTLEAELPRDPLEWPELWLSLGVGDDSRLVAATILAGDLDRIPGPNDVGTVSGTANPFSVPFCKGTT